MKKMIICIECMFLIMVLSACNEESRYVISYSVQPQDTVKVTLTNEVNNLIKHEVKNIKLSVVGDLMFHEYQLSRSYDPVNNQFDFSDQFKDVASYISTSNYAIGNLETTFAGPKYLRSFNIQGYSGYPCFNTPDIAASNIKDAGFDLVTTANNHSLDSGVDGLMRTLDILDQYEINHVGTYRTSDDSNQIKLVDIDGIEFAFISCTYAMNGFETPENQDYIIHSLDLYSLEKEKMICDLVEKASDMNPDFVVVMPHFGNEYVEYQNSYQEEFVDMLFEAGADLIFGSHPHVLQPIEVREIIRADGSIDQGLVIYSLGNFISSQKAEPGMNKDLGVILGLDIEKTDLQKAKIVGISFVPTYTYWSDDVIGVVPVDETLDKIDKGTIAMTGYDLKRLQFAREYTVDHLMTYLDGYEYEYKDYEYYIKFE